MLSESRVALCECFIAVVVVLCIISPVLGRSWKFQTRHPRIAKRLRSWGDQPLWAMYSICLSVVMMCVILSGPGQIFATLPGLIMGSIILPCAIGNWRTSYVKARADRMLEREREINALMPHDRIVESIPVNDSEPGHLPHV